jgi:glutamate:Na+ symporter, ESS family
MTGAENSAMNIPFSFQPLLLFGCLAILLLAGVALRAFTPFLQRFLIPSCLIGGLLGLILLNIGVISLSGSDLETFAYHCFNISFISVGLTHNPGSKKKTASGGKFMKGPLWLALVQGVTFPLQAIVGGIFLLIFNFFGFSLHPVFGLLPPLGFAQGPGQALSVGKVWEAYGFEHAATLGLTFAAFGFMFAFFAGVPLVNLGIRKGFSSQAFKAPAPDFKKGVMPKNKKRESAGELTTHSGNVETLAFHAALIGLVYVLTYFLLQGLAEFVTPNTAKALWGFFFFFGMILALLVRILMKTIGIGHLIDPGIQNRITGLAVDFMIVSTVMAIQTVILWKYFFPLLAIALATGIVTTLAVIFLGKKLPSYNLERTAAIYGITTGTVSCGLLLLRLVDPNFKTPVIFEMGLMVVFASPVIIVCMLLLNAPFLWDWSIPLTVLSFLAFMTVNIVLLRAFGFWRKGA